VSVLIPVWNLAFHHDLQYFVVSGQRRDKHRDVIVVQSKASHGRPQSFPLFIGRIEVPSVIEQPGPHRHGRKRIPLYARERDALAGTVGVRGQARADNGASVRARGQVPLWFKRIAARIASRFRRSKVGYGETGEWARDGAPVWSDRRDGAKLRAIALEGNADGGGHKKIISQGP